MQTKTPARKRKPSSRIVDENFVGAESNPVTKRLRLSANAAQAGSIKRRPRQPSVEDVEDEGDTSANSSPKNPNSLLEAADGSDDVEMLDKDPALEDFEEESDEDGPEVLNPVETAEAERSESMKTYKDQMLAHPNSDFPIRTTI
jgi:hypothetical protein